MTPTTYRLPALGLAILLALGWGCQSRTGGPANASHCDPAMLEGAITLLSSLSTSPPEDSLALAARTLDEALARWGQCPLDSTQRHLMANLYRLHANVAWRSEDWVAVRHHLTRALAFRPTGLLQARLHTNYGTSHFNEGAYRLALPHFDSALMVQPPLPAEPYYTVAALFAGDAYVRTGQPRLGEAYLAKALAAVQAGHQPGRAVSVYQSLASCKRKLGRHGEAVGMAQHALTIQMGRLQSNDDSLMLANGQLILANVWQDSLQHCPSETPAWREAGAKATTHYDIARQLYRQLKDTLNEWKLEYNLGELARRQGRPAEAEAALSLLINRLVRLDNAESDESKDLLKRYGLLAKAYIARGEAVASTGDTMRAAADFDAALRYLTPTSSPSPAMEITGISGPVADPGLVALALHEKAQLAVAQGQAGDTRAFDTALSLYDSLLAFANKAKQDQMAEEDDIGLEQEIRPYIDSAFMLCLHLAAFRPKQADDYLALAFRYAERSKATALLSTLLEKQSATHLTEAQQAQRARLIALHNDIRDATFRYRHDPDLQAALMSQWADYQIQWRDFQATLPSSSHQQAALALCEASDIRQGVLAEGQAMLHYHEVGRTLHLMVVRKEGITHRATTLPLGVEGRVAAYKTMLARHRIADEAEFCTTARQLYHALLPTDLRGSLPKRLVVVPSELLQNLPFEALWTGHATGAFTDLDSARHYLVFRHDISYAPSASLLCAAGESRPATSALSALAVFAPSFEEGTLQRLRNDEEADRIAQKVAVAPYKAQAATKTAFLSDYRRHRAVHVFTHGILDAENPRYNHIVFSTEGPTKDAGGNLLYMHELYDRIDEWDVDFMALIACQTAVGPQVQGEGHISLARGLVAAGVRSLVATFWPIQDESTLAITPAFYGHSAGPDALPKDVAMAEAKRAYLADPDALHPHKWAGLAIIGDTSPLVLKAAGTGGKMWWILVLLVPLALVWRRWR